MGVTEILRCAKDLKLKARAVNETWSGLSQAAAARDHRAQDETFIIVGKVERRGCAGSGSRRQTAPQIIKRAEFEA